LGILSKPYDVLRASRGWHRLLLSVAIGAMSALTFAPLYLFPFLLLGYACLVALLDGAAEDRRNRRAALAIGWGYGFGLFFVGLHWIGYAFLVNAEAHAWQMPFALVLFPAFLAVFPAIATMAASLLWRPGPGRVFWFAACFVLAEWLRGHVLTGFPWNVPGYGWGASTAVLQTTSVIGIYGLSLFTVLFGASLVLLAPRSRYAAIPAALLALFVLFWAGGALRLANATAETVSGVQLRIVQPATPQGEKYAPALRAANWQRLYGLSVAPAQIAPTHIIWPEAAVPVFGLIHENAAGQSMDIDGSRIISEVVGNGSVLLTGAVKLTGEGDDFSYYNSLYAFSSAGLLAAYDKFHLVPFGEYLPFEPVLTALGLTQIAGGVSGFSAGPGPRTLEIEGAPSVSPLICYEAVFPGQVVGTPRPGWLVNITDDTWFGPNAGPLQHLLIARVRGIEEGLPIVRAANAGISVIADAYGRIHQRLELGERNHLDGPLPVALTPTLYARFGRMIFFLLVLLSVGAAFLPYRVNRT